MPDPTPRPAPPRVGRRGTFLLIAAVVWAITGLQVLTSPVEPGGLVHQEWPLPIRVILWLAPAVTAVVYAFRAVDWPAYVLLLPAPLIRALSYTWAWATWHLSGGEEGMERGWAFAAASVAMSAFVALVAGWPETTTTVPADPEDSP